MIALSADLQRQVDAERFVRFVAEHECIVVGHPDTVAMLPEGITSRLEIRSDQYVLPDRLYAIEVPKWLW